MKKGQTVLYQNGDSYYLGKIKHVDGEYAFIQTHLGETASRCNISLLKPFENEYAFLILKKSVETDEGEIYDLCKNISNSTCCNIKDIYNILNYNCATDNINNKYTNLVDILLELKDNLCKNTYKLSDIFDIGFKVFTLQGVSVNTNILDTHVSVNIYDVDILEKKIFLDENSSKKVSLLLK